MNLSNASRKFMIQLLKLVHLFLMENAVDWHHLTLLHQIQKNRMNTQVIWHPSEIKPLSNLYNGGRNLDSFVQICQKWRVMYMYAVSVSSDAVEREFSISGRVITKQRNRLSPQTIGDLMQVKRWITRNEDPKKNTQKRRRPRMLMIARVKLNRMMKCWKTCMRMLE